MNTQKYLSIFAFLILHVSFGCSTHPEIKPYEAQQELAVDDSSTNKESLDLPEDADGFIEDADLPAEENTVQVAQSNEVSTPEKVAPVAKAPPVVKDKKEKMNRVPASTLKNGFFVFANDCEMKSAPGKNGSSVGSVSKGKKLWLDVHNSSWLKAYKKNGTAYVPTSCVK